VSNLFLNLYLIILNIELSLFDSKCFIGFFRFGIIIRQIKIKKKPMKRIQKLVLIGVLLLIQINKNFGQIDGITLIPINGQLVLSDIDSDIFEKGSTPLGVSIHSQLILQKELNQTVDIFAGVGYSNNSELAKIRKTVREFSDLTSIGWNNIINEDSSLQVKQVNYSDEYFTIPIGIRCYSTPKDEKGIKLVFSSGIEFSFLIDSTVDVDIVKKVNSGFFRISTTETVFNTQYEKDAEMYFENKIEKFLINLQLCGGYEWRTGKHFSFGNELVINAFLKEHKTDLLKNKVMIGAQLRLIYHFD